MSNERKPLVPPDQDVEPHSFDPSEVVRHWVFVSHTSADAPFVRSEIKAVARAEQLVLHVVNKDSGPVVSQPYKRQILRSLSRCASFLVVLSRSSVASRWVRFEVEWAIRYRARARSAAILLDDSRPTDLAGWLREIAVMDYSQSWSTARDDLTRILRVWSSES